MKSVGKKDKEHIVKFDFNYLLISAALQYITVKMKGKVFHAFF